MFLKNDRIYTAISIVLDVAFYAGRTEITSGADIAKRNGFLRRGIEPILQILSREKILGSVRGPKGGYNLKQSPRVITLLKIAMPVCHDDQKYLFNRHQNNDLLQKVLDPLWQNFNEDFCKRLSAITIEDLLKEAEKKGLKSPAEIIYSFTI